MLGMDSRFYDIERDGDLVSAKALDKTGREILFVFDNASGASYAWLGNKELDAGLADDFSSMLDVIDERG